MQVDVANEDEVENPDKAGTYRPLGFQRHWGQRGTNFDFNLTTRQN